ncbi:aminotransferase class III-fold pyridoxal phosphate-dependent enzyme [Actinokineospora auranticolor]|uniref:Aminotransferase class III n=1 Tax=Actinokineospora auranticolor TaxID=155976 RepID=A0A2S6GYW6_9PSEU|nr:aminotransferase class III-fold pyridoxal phosphate-dependent enzyme [Actinokineospora auranticolor]PPK70424.1 aminotransferase class III [Actinokineospora auranticolor]
MTSLVDRRAAAVAAGVTSLLPGHFATHTEPGALRDQDGTRLIDLGSGIGVTSVGNAAPAVVAAVQRQAAEFTHACFMVNPYESYVAVCERLNELTPGAHEKRSALFNSGAGAVENAVKIARHATGRSAVAVFDHAYHGRTNLTLAAGGLPLAGVTGRAELMDAVHPGGLGGTYGGNPLACAAALATVDTMRADHLADAANRIGAAIRSRLAPLLGHPALAEVRGRGAMVGLEFVGPGGAPAPEVARRVAADCHRAGVIVLTCGTYANVIRLIPPLVIPAPILDEGLTLWRNSRWFHSDG